MIWYGQNGCNWGENIWLGIDILGITLAGMLILYNAQDETYFITTWRTTGINESVTIPVGGYAGIYTIDWGDGTAPITGSGDQSHVCATLGYYQVRISGDFARIDLSGDGNNARKIHSIDRWGIYPVDCHGRSVPQRHQYDIQCSRYTQSLAGD